MNNIIIKRNYTQNNVDLERIIYNHSIKNKVNVKLKINSIIAKISCFLFTNFNIKSKLLY